MIRTTREVGASEGLFIAPEGAACFAALRSLVAAGKIFVGRADRDLQHGLGDQISRMLRGEQLTEGQGNLVPSYLANAKIFVSQAFSGECPSGCGLQISFKLGSTSPTLEGNVGL